MNSTCEDTFEYRHKKFDQSKRLRSDSLSSSTEDYECIKVKIERITESPFLQSMFEKSPALHWSSTNNKDDTLILPPAKRPRLSSYSPTICQHTSTPITVAAAVVPPAAAILPKISDETLRSICKYHGNMVRKFPKKERTPKDQERRNKNTIACRMSRRVKKLEHIAIEEQYKEFSQQTFDIIEQSMRATAYLHELMKLTSCEATELKTPDYKRLHEKTSTSTPPKKPFTVAFLTGKE